MLSDPISRVWPSGIFCRCTPHSPFLTPADRFPFPRAVSGRPAPLGSSCARAVCGRSRSVFRREDAGLAVTGRAPSPIPDSPPRARAVTPVLEAFGVETSRRCATPAGAETSVSSPWVPSKCAASPPALETSCQARRCSRSLVCAVCKFSSSAATRSRSALFCSTRPSLSRSSCHSDWRRRRSSAALSRLSNCMVSSPLARLWLCPSLCTLLPERSVELIEFVALTRKSPGPGMCAPIDENAHVNGSEQGSVRLENFPWAARFSQQHPAWEAERAGKSEHQ